MKRLSQVLLSIVLFLVFIPTIKAGSLSLSASSSASVNSAVKVRVNINNLAGRFRVTSSDNSVLAGSAEDFWESSQTVIFTAKKSGRATITVTPVDVADYDSGASYTSSRSVTINVSGGGDGGSSSTKSNNKTVDINKTYSSNNNLSSLSVEGYDLDPTFDKEKTEYKIELDSDVKSINVKASAEDENATVKGTGEVSVSEGMNNIKITVVAENGNEKVYTIIANVEDKNPIKVKIGKKKYTVVKNIDDLKAPDNYTKTTVKIDDNEVPAFTNEITGYILVGLKDNKGNISLFIYNPSNGKFSKYQELSFDGISIQYLKAKKIPKCYKKYIIKINDQNITVYKKNKKDTYALVYGMNLNNGDINWYSYDTKENTLQRYNIKDLDKLSILNNKYLITIIILSVSSLLLLFFMLILMLKIRNHKRS